MPYLRPWLLLGGVGAVLDGVRDVGEPVARHHRGDPGLHRQPGGLRQRLVGGDQRADTERERGVAVPAVEDRAAVDRHQVARGQHLVADGIPCTTRSLTDEQMLAGKP